MADAIESANLADYPTTADGRRAPSPISSNGGEPIRRYNSNLSDNSYSIGYKPKNVISEIKTPTAREGKLNSAKKSRCRKSWF